MAGKPPRFRVHALGLPEQQTFMQGIWPGMDSRIVSGTLVSRGEVQPTPLSAWYLVRVEYRPGSWPKAFVESPALRRRSPEEAIPHTYPGPRPCLYYPKAREWSPDLRLADTILPWLLLWLFHYEVWLAGGDWQGGGIHPRAPVKDEHPAL
jgi:hypothetical protein